jgi:nucleoside-diphosphate-sugar epimerase
MRVLVTGSSGLVGAALARSLKDQGVEVVPFDCRDGAATADIRNRAALDDAIAGCDGVIHLAAVSRVAWGESAPDLCNAVNVTGTSNVIAAATAAPGKPWLLFASSREVYGRLDTIPADERAPLRPANVYGKSKIDGEICVSRAREGGLRAAVIRLSNVYGALNDHPDRAVPSLLWAAMHNRDLTISGADTYFDFVHVDDCVRGIIALMARLADGKVTDPVHLVSGKATNLLELAVLARSVTESASEIIVKAARPFDVPGFVGDPRRAVEVLDWWATISLRSGLERLWAGLCASGRPMDDVGLPPADVARQTGVAVLAHGHSRN